jgi:hypothetical protein
VQSAVVLSGACAAACTARTMLPLQCAPSTQKTCVHAHPCVSSA